MVISTLDEIRRAVARGLTHRQAGWLMWERCINLADAQPTAEREGWYFAFMDGWDEARRHHERAAKVRPSRKAGEGGIGAAFHVRAPMIPPDGWTCIGYTASEKNVVTHRTLRRGDTHVTISAGLTEKVS